jgi:hypothetical protein
LPRCFVLVLQPRAKYCFFDLFAVLAIGILLMGSSLLGTLLSLRASTEGFSNTVIGIVMSVSFVGYVIGAYTCPRLLRDVGYIRSFASIRVGPTKFIE